MKHLALLITFSLCAWTLSAQYTVTLDLVESVSGGCGQQSNCGGMTVCYDLYGTPSVNGAWLASYDIWYVINGGANNGVVYSSDATCIIIDNNDLPPSGATTFIRVGASQGNSSDVLNGSTLLHNFCVTYTSLAALDATTIVAGGSFSSFNSNMSVNLMNVPTNANLVPATLNLSTSNNSCLLLPIEWLDFEARRKETVSVLDWSTATEINSDYYDVQRAGDGKHFTSIGTVKSIGNTNDVSVYQFVDKNPLAGINYYRLKQFDIDGGSDLSPIRQVVFSGDRQISVFPNPVTDLLYVAINGFAADEQEQTLFEIVTLEGKIIRSGTLENIDFKVDVTGIEAGAYIINVQDGNTTSSHRFIKAK